MKEYKTQYKVIYSEFEGDNYAGGWCDRIAVLDSLAKAGNIQKVKKIIKLEVYEHPEPVPITEALEAARVEREEQKKILNLKKARDLREEADRLERANREPQQ